MNQTISLSENVPWTFSYVFDLLHLDTINASVHKISQKGKTGEDHLHLHVQSVSR